ncbi:glycoside hydrolase domain-containing protein [Rathayibacter sp. AY1B5]|uniref:glycoside hydrolase domain-containing protein n=1 Tax=Rathayibacter sp. AY1B5 TaxID=2080530 RepID=UPI000CE763C7|nr:glycoside hydrolase domain-containing protein [Rathayibacter sp. AY1B5]PPI27328.1 hypothetical protein C5D44_04705 [Rathayibacter sp. AY1B5]
MVDQWVLNSQTWVNNKYANVPGFVAAPLDGKPGWKTMFALTRALQWELGITALSDNFGAGTLSALTTKFPSVSSATTNANIRGIVQAALWCKGYSGMAITGGTWTTWDSTTSNSIVTLRANLGLSAAPTIFPKLFKSLLTMDAYTLVSAGSTLVRSIQRSLNTRYNTRRDFFLLPCDGLYSRDVQTGLLYALQFEIGMDDGVANGFLGPATKAGLSSAAANVAQGSSDSDKYFVHLFQAALVFNGFYSGPYDGIFSATMAANVKLFQVFTMLPQTGRADWKTWASLLVSTGDPERTDSAKAVDCITAITSDRAATLKANGYSIVGRYLTNTPFVEDPTDKNIKAGELTTIFGNALRVFPIFQEGSHDAASFDKDLGSLSGYRAYSAARAYGFKDDTVIYFAVDFDALEEEIYGSVVPYFQGVNEAFINMGKKYRIGVYGARNTCAIVSAAKLAVFSFVSGMSTGYSGNLGYPLPKNWAFDQIKEYTIGTGSGAIGVDKNIVQGRDGGQAAVSLALNADAFAYVDKIQQAAETFVSTRMPGLSPSVLTLQYLRYPEYNDANALWASVAGAVVIEFIQHVDTELKIPRITALIEPQESRALGLAHLAVAANGVTFAGLKSVASEAVNVADMAGWAGDVIQNMVNWIRWGQIKYGANAFANEYIGKFDELEWDNQFPWSDLIQDVDGVNLGNKLRNNPALSFAQLFRAYYGTSSTAGWRTRYSTFKTLRFGTDDARAIKIATAALIQTSDQTYNVNRAALVTAMGATEGAIANNEKGSIARGFYEVLKAKAVGH